jgi:hypothetical protein
MGLIGTGGIMPKKGKDVKEKHTTYPGKTGWELALEKASSHLYKNKVQRSRLLAAIRLFREKIKNGDPWPTEQEASSGQHGVER